MDIHREISASYANGRHCVLLFVISLVKIEEMVQVVRVYGGRADYHAQVSTPLKNFLKQPQKNVSEKRSFVHLVQHDNAILWE